MLNKIVVVGRLTKNPEVRTIPSGSTVALFTVAVERSFAGKDGNKETDFIPVAVWNGTAEACGKYLVKGNMVAVEGRLQVRNYEDKDGNKRTIAEIVANEVQFLTPKKDSAAPTQGLDEVEPLDDIPW